RRGGLALSRSHDPNTSRYLPSGDIVVRSTSMRQRRSISFRYPKPESLALNASAGSTRDSRAVSSYAQASGEDSPPPVLARLDHSHSPLARASLATFGN